MNTTVKNIFALFASSLMLSSCATILSSGDPTITIDGPSNTPVTIITERNHYSEVYLPAKVKINRHHIDGQVVRVTRQDGKTKTFMMEKGFNGLTLLNILLGGLVGFGIDCATNCVAKPAQKYFYCEPRFFENVNEGTKENVNKTVYGDIDAMFENKK